MKKYILPLLATAQLSLAAVGDIQSVTTRAEGWTADVAIEGLNIGGTYAPGTGVNNAVTGNEKMVLTVTSHGFNGITLTTKVRTVYGVMPMRKAWPNDAQNEETNVTGVTTVRVILSDLIYDEDDAGAGNSGTVITASFLGGFYTSSGTPTNATSSPITVTNLSTVPFQPVIDNWSWPGWQRMSSSTRLRAVAYHRHPEQYRPLNTIRFSVTDGVTTNYQTVTGMTLPHDFGDAIKVVEYITTNDLTAGLTQGAELTWNYVAYPWVGDNPSDTSTGAAAPSPLVGPQKAICDRTGAYGVTYAVVDPINGSDPAVGSDTGKWVGDGSNPGAGSGVTAYATMARAARAVRDYNNANRSPARDDVGAAVVYMKAYNAYQNLGATITGGYGATPKTWITFMPFPGVAREDVVITGSSGNTNVSDRVKLDGLTINTTTDNTFSGCDVVWLHNCDLTSTGTMFNTSGQVIYLTQCKINQFDQGLRGFSTGNISFALVRGCDLDGFDEDIVPYTFLGNVNNVPTTSLRIVDGIAGMTGPRPIPIIAYNKILGLNGVGSTKLSIGYSANNLTGMALIQNVFENSTTGEAGLAGIGGSIYEHNNYMVWHTTFVGQRVFMGYNDTGSTAYYRRYWSQLNSYWDRWANKGDNFTTQDANRIGGWQVKFGVGFSGNYLSQNMISVPGNFYAEYGGLSSFQTDESATGDIDEALFANRLSATPTLPGAGTATAGAGGGDYDILTGSPLIGLPIVNAIPYDLAGVLRTSTNTASGAYAGPDAPAPPATLNATDTNAVNIHIQ